MAIGVNKMIFKKMIPYCYDNNLFNINMYYVSYVVLTDCCTSLEIVVAGWEHPVYLVCFLNIEIRRSGGPLNM